MQANLAYGKGHLAIEVPSHAHVIEPLYTPALAEPIAAVRQALAEPIESPALRDLVQPNSRITIVHCDGTRPMPNALILQAISEVLDEVGVPDTQVTLLNALGTHRLNSEAELSDILGPIALRRYQSLQSFSTDSAAQCSVGTLPDGAEVKLNRAYVEADVRILLGFIEPHFFAGYSGGPKLVVPGVASQSTVEHIHQSALVGHAQSTWGVTKGNPLWETLYAAATLVPPTFIVNVALNRAKEITAVFAGNLLAAHCAGIEYVRERVMRPAEQLFDIVVTTNSGFPLDQNLYQSVKGMSAAARVVKHDGVIIMASECSDGIPNHGAFAEIIEQGGHSPEGVLNLIQSPGFNRPDQWQAQVLAMVCKRAKVYLYSAGVSPSQAKNMMLEPTNDITALLSQLTAEHELRNHTPASICVLPEGPQTIPFLVE